MITVGSSTTILRVNNELADDGDLNCEVIDDELKSVALYLDLEDRQRLYELLGKLL